MGKFFLNIILACISIHTGVAQLKTELVLDTMLHADNVYLDPLNQIYLINNSEKSIAKFNIGFQLMKKISFNQGWDQAVMDVSDPFKSILYYPGDYKILILDESLSVISAYDESDLNAQSAVCHFTTNYIAIFSNNLLKLKNYEQQKSLSSEPLYYIQTNNTQDPFQLKQSNEYLYLLRPGYGISRFTNQLFEEQSWTFPGHIKKMDVTGERIFYAQENELITFDTKFKTEALILKEEYLIKSFAINSEYIVLLNDNHLKLMKWQN